MTLERRGVRSIEVGSALLDALADSVKPMMLRDLASAAGLASAQAHAYLVSYRKLGLVEQQEQNGRYLLGPLALQLGLARLRSVDPLKIAAEACFQLTAETELTVALAVWGAYGPTVVQVREGKDQIDIDTKPGTVYSVTGTATGRVFAALLARNVVEAAIQLQRSEGNQPRYVGKLPRLNDPAVGRPLASIRASGYSVTDSDPLPGIGAIAVPILGALGQLQLVATVIGASSAIDLHPDGKHVPKTLALAATISRRLGHGGSIASTPAGSPEGAGVVREI
jgi:DNA-binding IclR family transcriptional regulator